MQNFSNTKNSHEISHFPRGECYIFFIEKYLETFHSKIKRNTMENFGTVLDYRLSLLKDFVPLSFLTCECSIFNYYYLDSEILLETEWNARFILTSKFDITRIVMLQLSSRVSARLIMYLHLVVLRLLRNSLVVCVQQTCSSSSRLWKIYENLRRFNFSSEKETPIDLNWSSFF